MNQQGEPDARIKTIIDLLFAILVDELQRRPPHHPLSISEMPEVHAVKGGTRLLYTVAEAAALLGIGRSKAYELAAAVSIPTVRIGRALRIPAEELARWIQEFTVPAVPPASSRRG